MVMGIANLAMADPATIGREGVGRQPASRSEQRSGLVRHGLFPARIPRLPSRVGRHLRHQFESNWGVGLQNEPGLRIRHV